MNSWLDMLYTIQLQDSNQQNERACERSHHKRNIFFEHLLSAGTVVDTWDISVGKKKRHDSWSFLQRRQVIIIIVNDIISKT